MSEQQNKWRSILESANALTANEIINNGSIMYVDLLDERTIWHIHVELEKVVAFDEIISVMQKVATYFYAEANIDLIRFTWHYRKNEFSKDIIEDYFRAGINSICKKNRTILVLNKYTKEYSTNKVTYYVASESDKMILLDAMKLLKQFLVDFGLDSILVDVVISKNEIDYAEQRDKEIKIHDQQADWRSYEQQIKAVETRKFEREKKQNKEYRNSKAVKLELEELPSTSMQVQEFRQKNSTDVVIFEGVLVSKEIRKAGKYELFVGVVTNHKDSITIKHFLNDHDKKFYRDDLIVSQKLSIKGSLQYDNFANDVVVMSREITTLGLDEREIRIDGATEKRIELHAHTKMSTLDSVMDVDKYVKVAKSFGHKAVAVTDHANCHVLPEFFEACKKNDIKAIAGVEGYFIDDYKYPIALTDHNINLHDATFVVFDVETTGFSTNYNEIIEIGAVKIYKGMPVDEFSTFIKPNEPITPVITALTGITNTDVLAAPKIDEVLP